jgi:hypothetical protein
MGHYQLDCGCYVDCKCEKEHEKEYVYYNWYLDNFVVVNSILLMIELDEKPRTIYLGDL